MAENRQLLQLYPKPGEIPLTGLYLRQNIRALVGMDNKPCVYTNFLTSLDGRISLPDEATGKQGVPAETGNERDWRLLLELAAPADAIIMSGRFLRDLAEGDAQSLPPFSGDTPQDLRDYRREAGLTAAPELVFVTRTLDIPTRALDMLADRQLLVATVSQASPERAEAFTQRGIELLTLGEQTVDGELLIEALAERGHRLIYSIAGPEVLYTLLAADVVERIYLTTALRMLAGEEYATLARGPKLDPPRDFKLTAIYLDPYGPGGVEQLLQVYTRLDREMDR